MPLFNETVFQSVPRCDLLWYNSRVAEVVQHTSNSIINWVQVWA